MMNTEEIQSFFERSLRASATEWIALPQSGSARRNFIASISERKFVITFNDNVTENEVFFYFSEIFSQNNLNTPQIIAFSEDRKVYIQDFLGENTLSEVISKENLNFRLRDLVKKTLDRLYTLQIKTLGKVDFTKTFEYETYNQLPILHDLFYFKNFMIDVLEIEYHKSSLLKEFMQICTNVEALQPRGLMIRDFQARNIMVNEKDEVFFIDYQGAMEGPLMYDVISFLFQAKANFPKELKNEMLEYYISLFKNPELELQLKASVNWLKLMRFLQVLGAYGFRGLIQRKPHFLQSIHQGIKNISDFTQDWKEIQNFPELEKVIKSLVLAEKENKINQFIQ